MRASVFLSFRRHFLQKCSSPVDHGQELRKRKHHLDMLRQHENVVDKEDPHAVDAALSIDFAKALTAIENFDNETFTVGAADEVDAKTTYCIGPCSG